VKKTTLYTLDVDGYAPEITRLTRPFLKHYAAKIGAELVVINQRLSPVMPVAYEKFQVFDLSQQRGDDWSIYVDGDALIHPEAPDYTELIPRDTIFHHGHDFAGIRWRTDNYFRRDGRNWSVAGWLTAASEWCRDIWQPLADLTLDQALANIFPTPHEAASGLTPAHFIDEYVMSRNIARYGIKATSIMDWNNAHELRNAPFFFHQYTYTTEQKVAMLQNFIAQIR
jgi:hypothetical protein